MNAPASPTDWIHVVLVEPGESLNIGSVARLMSNLGFKHLHIVAPPRYDRARAAITACWGEGLLDSASHHKTVAEALKDMEDVVAFSAVEGKNRAPAVELIPWADETLKHPRQTALLFGPEDTGLLQHHIEHARLSVAIPANSENRSFNLSNAVLLALYELQRGAKSLVGVNHELGADAKPSSAQQHQQLDKLVEELAVASGFYNLGTSAGLKSLMKNLTRRMQPTEREMNVLLGLFGTSVGSIRRTGR
jgi:tRNA/rRNA methyltransferase